MAAINKALRSSRVFCRMQNITEVTVIGLKFCFWDKQEHVSGENVPEGRLLMSGTTWTSLHKHSRLSPNNSSTSKLSFEMPRESQGEKENRKTRHVAQNSLLGHMLPTKVCQHIVKQKRVDMCKDH